MSLAGDARAAQSPTVLGLGRERPGGWVSRDILNPERMCRPTNNNPPIVLGIGEICRPSKIATAFFRPKIDCRAQSVLSLETKVRAHLWAASSGFLSAAFALWRCLRTRAP